MRDAVLRAWIAGSAALRGDEAQDAYEYILVVGGLVVVLVIAFMGLDAVIAQLLGMSCPSVDTAKGITATAGSCVQ